MIHRIYSFMLLASFALAACGGDGGPPDKLSEAILESIQLRCQKAFDCQSSYIASMHDNEPFADYVGGSNVDACVNSVRTLVLAFSGQDYFTKLDASVTAGRIKYNPNDYDTCVTAGEASTCDQYFEQNGATYTPPAACGTSAVGQVATGGACTLSDDCAAANDLCDATAHTCG